MKKRILVFVFSIVLSGLWVFLLPSFGSADPIAVDRAFHFRDNRSANTALYSSGERLTYGAHWVVPNGDAGTTGSASQGTVTTPLEFEPFATSPNHFAWAVPYDPSLTGQWTLTFTNNVHTTDTTSILTPSVDSAPRLPFAASVAISGSGSNPTFTWTFPENYLPDGIRIQIWDLENRLPSGIADVIHVQTLPGESTTYTVPSILSTGQILEQGNLYALEITFALTHGEPLGDNTTLLSRSRSFFNFVLMPPDAPPDVFLPTVIPGPVPVYSFHTTVDEGQTIFIDPLVAIGYEYVIGAGDPSFASVIPPAGVGDDFYDLYLLKNHKYCFKARLEGGVPYAFDAGGVDRFLILGIEKEAGLDVDNPTAFITGLTFTGAGSFTGTMTPITESMEAKATGVGWILSAAGAYKEDPAVEGNAVFGFTANYSQRTPLPTGIAEFVFQPGRLRFNSYHYQLLTVDPTGTNGQIKGTGTINGAGDYSFMIWAGDIYKGWGADTFRVKIWETTTGKVVYDNGTDQEIAGGLIRIEIK
jgi:hypothetical protein